MKRLAPALQCIVIGSVIGFLANAAWWLVSGDLPNFWVVSGIVNASIAGWTIGQAVRFERAWSRVQASYYGPTREDDN